MKILFTGRHLFVGMGLGFFLQTSRLVGATTFDVSVGNNFFSPSSVTINVNDTVKWTKSGSGFHSITGSGLSSGSATTSPFTYSFLFTSPGTFNYQCGIHLSSMPGSVTASPPPQWPRRSPFNRLPPAQCSMRPPVLI